MKIFSVAKNKKLDRNSAMALAGLNLLATPGLGTILAGRFFVGALQLAMAASGFMLIIKWFYDLLESAFSGNASAPSWEWQSGALFFFAGWLASAWSSYNFVRAASAQATPQRSLQTPPKLDGSPG
jgi:hypothetical protein